MSTYAAVGAVSNTLKVLLSDKIDVPPTVVAPVPVTVGPPPDDPTLQAGPLVNLFLYRICENAALKNQEPPGRGDPGAYGVPPLALDLHYLLTAYGTTTVPAALALEDEVVAHYLLGSAMRVLHDYPVVTPALETSLGAQILDQDLVHARERVKLTLQPISLEDLSKVWTALSRPFRASAAYEVTVVQIEPKTRARHAQPVGPEGPISGPHIRAVAGLAPIIDELHAAGRTGAQVRVGESLVLDGSGLLGDATQVDLGGLKGIGQVTSARSGRLTVVVPDDPRLAPGILTLRVHHGVTFGAPPQRRPTFASNTVAFALVPRVTACTLAGTTITITGNRLMASGVECLTVVGGETVKRSAYDPTSTPAQLKLPLPSGLTPGEPARVFVRVNGVQSIDTVTVTP